MHGSFCVDRSRWGLLTMAVLVAGRSALLAAAAVDDNLGYKWRSTSNGPNVELVDAKNAAVKSRPNGDAGIAIQLTTDISSFQPLVIRFDTAENPDPASTAPPSHFFLGLNLTNKTDKDWRGYHIAVVDDNEQPYYDVFTQANGTLRHPNRAHLHSDSFRYDALMFTKVTRFYSVQRTTNLGTGAFVIEDRVDDLSSAQKLDENIGMYAIRFEDNVIPINQNWNPTKFVYNAARPNDLDFNAGASVLDLHARIHLAQDGVTPDTAFLLILTPIPVPEPSVSGAMLLAAATGLWRRRRGGV